MANNMQQADLLQTWLKSRVRSVWYSATILQLVLASNAIYAADAVAEPSGIILQCNFSKVEITAQGSTDTYPFSGSYRTELALDAKTACLEGEFSSSFGAETQIPKKCFELEVSEEKFVVRKDNFKEIGRRQSETKGPFVIFRHSGQCHTQNVESHFNGDFVKVYDFFCQCEKIGEFTTKKKF
jgi:hypothetical protein